MASYHIRFFGRAIGAIGVFSWHTVIVLAEGREDAFRRLYDTHEHISGASIIRVGTES